MFERIIEYICSPIIFNTILDKVTKPIAEQNPAGLRYVTNLKNFKDKNYIANEDKENVVKGIKELQKFLTTMPKVTKAMIEQNGIDFLKHMKDVDHVDDYHIMAAPPGEKLGTYTRNEVSPHVVIKNTVGENLIHEALEKIGKDSAIHKIANYMLVSIANTIKNIDTNPESYMWGGFLKAVNFFNGDKGIKPQIDSVLNQVPDEVFDLFRVWKFNNFQIEFHRESAYICTDVIKHPAELASKLLGENPYLDYTIKVSFGSSDNLKKYTFSDFLDGIIVPGNPGQRDIIPFKCTTKAWSEYLDNHQANQDGEPILTEILYKLAHLPMYVDEERQSDIHMHCVIEDKELTVELNSLGFPFKCCDEI